jgi:hypothetical protein
MAFGKFLLCNVEMRHCRVIMMRPAENLPAVIDRLIERDSRRT